MSRTILLNTPRRVLIIIKPLRPSGLVRVSPAAIRELAAVIDHAWEVQMRGGMTAAGLYEEKGRRA